MVLRAVCVDRVSWLLCQLHQELGIRASAHQRDHGLGWGWGVVKSLKVVRCLGISLRRVTQFEVTVLSVYLLVTALERKKAQHKSLKTSGLCPLRYRLNMVLMH